MVLAGLATDRPARVGIAIDGLFQFKARLLEARGHRLQFRRDGFSIRRRDERSSRDLERAEPKPAILASAGAAAGRRWARERFEPQGSQAFLVGAERERVAVIALELARGGDRISGLLEQRGLCGLERLRIEHLPGSGLLLRGVANEPFREPRSQLLALKTVGLGGDRGLGRQPGVVLLFRRGGVGIDAPLLLHSLPEAGNHRVVVAVGDRVVLVVVAAGAADRHAEHARPERRHHVVELVVADRLDGLGSDLIGIRPRHEEAGGTRRLVVARLDQIARDLQAKELVVGHIGVDRLDHPVAVMKGTAAVGVELIAAAFAEPHRVEPVAGPAFAEPWACEQPFDKLFVGVGRRVGEKLLEFFRRRRQAGEVEEHPPSERFLAGLGAGGDGGRLLPGEDEPVDVVLRPGGVLHVGHRHRRQPAVRPVLSPHLDVDRPLVDDGRGLVAGIGCTHVDPFFEVGDHLVRQFSCRRHLEAVVLEGGEQQALLLLMWHDGGAALPTLGHAVTGIDEQVCLELACPEGLGGVALIAVLHEHRPNFRLEEGNVSRRRRGLSDPLGHDHSCGPD